MPTPTLPLPARWNAALLQAIKQTATPPPQAARILAIAHTAMFDAWANFHSRARATRTLGLLRQPDDEQTKKNRKKAVSFAAFEVMKTYFPTETIHETQMQTEGFDPADLAQAAQIGRLAARAVLDFRSGDGANAFNKISGPTDGFYADYTDYKPTPPPITDDNCDRWQPLFNAEKQKWQQFLVPHWARVEPFALPDGSFFRPLVPPAAAHSAKLRNEATEAVQISANLSNEQKAIVEYWMDGPASATPPGHWCEFAQFICQRDHLGMGKSIRLFFALSNALLDASIAAWDCKRAFDSARPITVVRHFFNGKAIKTWGGPRKGTVEMDGSGWLPYQKAAQPTPPFPEFVSGHSTFSSAAAEILKRFTGSDAFGHSSGIIEKLVVDENPKLLPSVELRWNTFSEAAHQAGWSRRLGGIHFEEGDLVGRRIGLQVADLVWKKAESFWK